MMRVMLKNLGGKLEELMIPDTEAPQEIRAYRMPSIPLNVRPDDLIPPPEIVRFLKNSNHGCLYVEEAPKAYV